MKLWIEVARLRVGRESVGLLLVAALAAACGDSASGAGGGGGGPADACPRDGVIPAELRDVERDAEGVSYATFGAVPDRTPDFARAAGVLSLLERVWIDGQARCVDLPAEVRSSIDASIETLKTSIPASDARTSAYAANDIHSQMTPLFAYFNPDAPTEVVDMDALFLRVGLDAYYEDWASFDANLTTLEADWAILRADAEARVPTCHRVAGTATVTGDIDDTLANLATHGTARDVDGAQVESDAGLLEVDILELLYDCAPDGTKPDTGIGSACATDADCGDQGVCDLANAGGTCSPDPVTSNTGRPCTTTVDCGTDSRDACNSEVGDGFPGGYCIMEPCDDVKVCSPGATCVALPFETPSCMAACGGDADCRDGYVCQLFPTTPPLGFGPSELACAFACADDEGCSPPLTCDVASGKCVP